MNLEEMSILQENFEVSDEQNIFIIDFCYTKQSNYVQRTKHSCQHLAIVITITCQAFFCKISPDVIIAIFFPVTAVLRDQSSLTLDRQLRAHPLCSSRDLQPDMVARYIRSSGTFMSASTFDVILFFSMCYF